MPTKSIQASTLRPDELDAVYAINKVVAETYEVDDALDQITKISRKVLIFDNAVIYLAQGENDLAPIFARAIGRGKESASELVWGDKAAEEVIKNGETFTHESNIAPDGDRLNQPYILGLPMQIGGQITGALIFIRFGGPEYTQEQINLAEFITLHISHLFQNKKLVERIANLEAERRLVELQDEFIAMVSHELNTPLGFIKGYTTTLLRTDTEWDHETQNEFLTIIDEEADRLSEMIENLLDSSRLQAGALPMDLRPVMVETIASDLQERYQSRYQNLTIEVKVPNTNAKIMTDPKRLIQVFDNLMNNINKYAPNSHDRIDFNINNNEVEITIRDDGPGIAPKHLPHLFDQFYRVPELSGGVRGSGLGLFIANMIVQAHNGSITVESKSNEGTCFCISLPLIEVNNG